MYKYYFRVQEALVGLGFMGIIVLTFMNAVKWLLDNPIISADDLSLLLFSWVALMGADVAMRYSRLVGMDILTSKLKPKPKKGAASTGVHHHDCGAGGVCRVWVPAGAQ